MYNQLQLREIFHIEFLRHLSLDLPLHLWTLKGGVNLRLFFKSIRYSEDIDLDVKIISIDRLKRHIMQLLSSPSFSKNLLTYGISEIRPPDIERSKQTSTTQRFKIHIITSSGEDYFTKIEFSRRGFCGEPVIESVPASVLRPYAMTPFVISHYPAHSAVIQKLLAISSRATIQPRDIFDLYILSSQVNIKNFQKDILKKLPFFQIKEYILSVDFSMFNDTVVSYLSSQDRKIYALPEVWDEIKLKTISFIEELERLNG